MTDRQAFVILTKTKCCITSDADTCIVGDGRCKTCPYYVDYRTELTEAIDHSLNILKNRDPELHFVQSLNDLQETFK